jgi:hypothetical protein
MFTTANGRNGFDVAYRQLSATGDTLNLNWITAYPAGTFAIYPKIVKHGGNVLLMWEEVAGTTSVGIQIAILSPAGAVVTPKFPLADKTIRLSPYYDLTALPNGKILWANQKGNDSISIYKLVESNATIRNQHAGANASMRLHFAANRLTLTAYKAGIFSIRQFDSVGKLLSEKRRYLVSGSHSLPLANGSVSFIEVGIDNEKANISVLP